MIKFLFMINPYPYLAYRNDPHPKTLAFCLFQPNSDRYDPGSKITYTNIFDALVNAVKSVLKGLGFPNAEIVVAEIGWPYYSDSDEVGATVENARAFIWNLMSHLRSMKGTLLMLEKSMDMYIFTLYDKDLSPGRCRSDPLASSDRISP
ncbi:glucan endo-1,3-beta-glucosidase 7-like [Elaeis guineensis]|uniref:Glucan endo-1,3-beta-glucosidase 7-like n=1 Tax=Elaeis guineensis var. tenera TaxID=51953 RepID=A0A6J0PI12_ELAGV|nr:glucan endo-1,3-beta-glucosidase 7-like [Elaeis guineensis]